MDDSSSLWFASSVVTFEAWPANQTAFRLTVAAQSWHWFSPEVRFAKVAEVLSSFQLRRESDIVQGGPLVRVGSVAFLFGIRGYDAANTPAYADLYAFSNHH